MKRCSVYSFARSRKQGGKLRATAAKFPGLPEAVPWSLLRTTHIPLYRKEFGSELRLPSRAQWPTLKLGRRACV